MGSRQVDTDVVVVGAGPAGSATAIACAERGLGVVLCERDRFVEDRPGETLHPGIEPLMAQLGLGDLLAQVAGARHSGVWIEWGGPRRFESFGEDALGAWSGFQVRRTAFDSAMIARARALGVDVRQPLGVTGTLVEEGEVRGVITDAGPIPARMVVDASGVTRWLSRKLDLKHTRHSPRLIARFGYVEGSCPERDSAPALVGDASGWTWTARVWRSTYQWTRVAFGGPPERGWIPDELQHLTPCGRVRGADVTWRLAARPAGPGWFIVGDAAACLDPTSSHGVLKALVSGMTAGHLVSAILNKNAPATEAASAYRQWLARWFAADAARLAGFYRELGAPGFA